MKNLFILVIAVFFLPVSAFAGQNEIPNLKIRDIIIVFKTHFDNGYTDMAESVINNYSTNMMEKALLTLEKSRSLPPEKQFVWTIPAWPMTQILQRCTPEIKPAIENAIREGWFAFHGLPFTFETEAGDPEVLVRSLSFAAELSDEFNLPLPRDAKLTDVPCHSWFLPTLLNNAGIKILHIGCNSVCSSPEVPVIFWWQGPDNSKLMTFYSAGDYGTSIVPDKEWKFKTWLAIIHTGDNQGPPSPEDVEMVIKKAQELAPNARIRIGRISDFYDAIMKEEPDLPVVRGDMPDTWIHGFMSMPREMKSVRTVQKDIFSFEMLNTLSNIWSGRQEDITRFIYKGMEGAMLWNEHTFGMAMNNGKAGVWSYGDDFLIERAAGTYKDVEASWKEKSDRIYQAEKIIEPAYNREIKKLASLVNVEGERIVVFNPLPWVRSGLITIQDESKIEALKDLRTGEIIPVHNKDNKLRFIAKDIPSSGYTTFVPVVGEKKKTSYTAEADEKNNIIENEFFRIKLDPSRGSAVSIINKKSGTEMVDMDSESGFGQYVYERFSKENVSLYIDKYIKVSNPWRFPDVARPNLDDTPYNRVNGGMAKITYSVDPVSVKAVMKFDKTMGNPHDYIVTYTLYNNLPYIELNWFIDGKHAESWPEAGWLSFPLKVKNPVFKVGRLGAVIDPSLDIVKGSNSDFYLINNGIAVHDDTMNGFAISTPDAPGISIEKTGLWSYSGNFIPKKPIIFINLYNNQYSTNFTEWIEGSWSVKMYLWSFQGYKNESSLISPNEEFRAPLKATLISAKPGILPVSKTGVVLSMKGILVTSFGRNPFGDGTLLRLWEQSGDEGKCKISLPEGAVFSKALPVNLRGESAGNTIPVKDNSFEIMIEAYKPASFLLEK
jgi:alpha-mannosidase